jgi:hypothetical protein
MGGRLREGNLIFHRCGNLVAEASVLVGMRSMVLMKRIPLLAAMFLGMPLFAAPLDVSRVPADSKWLLHLDLEAVRETAIGGELTNEIESRFGAKVRAMKRMFSVDVLKDLRGLTMFGNGRKDEAVVLIDGAMDRAHLEDVIAAADGYRLLDHGAFRVHVWTDNGQTQHAAFFNEGLLVFSEREGLLRSALDTLKGGASLPADGFFTAAPGKPMAVGFAKLRDIEMDGDEAQLLRRANTLKLALCEMDGRISGRMAVVADDAVMGQRIRRVLDGALAFAEMDENLAGKLELKTRVGPLDDGEGAAVEADLPVKEVVGLLENAGIFTKD